MHSTHEGMCACVLINYQPKHLSRIRNDNEFIVIIESLSLLGDKQKVGDTLLQGNVRKLRENLRDM